VYRRTQNSFTKALAFTFSQVPLGRDAQPNLFSLWRGCCRFELGARPANAQTLWVPDRCYLSDLLKVFGFAKSQAVPWHEHMCVLAPRAWQRSAAIAVVVFLSWLIPRALAAQRGSLPSTVAERAELLQSCWERGRRSFVQRLGDTEG